MKRSVIKHIQWLQSEIDGWISDGLIQADQGQMIRDRYPTPEGMISWSKLIFSSIGAVLSGLGVILIFAYNWETMHRFAKLTAIFISLALAHGFGMWFSRSESRFKPAGHGLHVMGTMLFGAGIWLIAQIYHIDEHYPNAFLAWGTGALALAWALPSVPQGIMASVLFVTWGGADVFDFGHPNHFSPAVILFGIFTLAACLQSRALTAAVIPSFIIAIAFNAGKMDDDLLLPVLFFYACAFIGGGLAIRKTGFFEHSAPILTFFGYLIYLTLLYLLTFERISAGLYRLNPGNLTEFAYFIIPLGIAAGLWITALHPGKTAPSAASEILRTDRIGVPIAMIFLLIQTAGKGFSDWHYAALYNILFLFHSIMMICHGCKIVSMKLTAAGCVLLSLLALSRYADLFESLIARSVVFFVIGGAIFLVGNFYSKAKKQSPQGLPRGA